jgi:hypothetical protein
MRPEDFSPPRLPDPDLVVFDADVFHPLDHWFGSRRCRSTQRSAWRSMRLHWQYEWSFGPWRDRFGWWHRVTGCWLGRHHYVTSWRREASGRPVFHRRFCWWCRRDDPSAIAHERIV